AEALEIAHEIEALEEVAEDSVEGISAEEPEESLPESSDAELPEPARMPTSLTAQLREQSGRYPHRVSRRMRRKMRGGPFEAAPGEKRPEAREAPFEQRTAPRPEPRPEARDRERPAQPSITDLLREGQEIIVQIAKEPLGQKGARITSYVALPGRFV